MQELQFETEADVKMWMINNQFNRRNLPIATRMKLAYRLKEIEAEKAKLRQSNLSNLKQFQNDVTAIPVSAPVRSPEEKGKTLESIAQKAGVSSRTAEQTDTPDRLPVTQREQKKNNKALEVIEKVRKGEVSADRAYQKIQRAERLEKYQLLNQLPEVA